MSKAKELWGHHAVWIYGAVLALVLVVVLGGLPFPVWLFLPLAVLVLATMVRTRAHDRSMCDYCMDLMPSDKEASAKRHEHNFQLVHAFGSVTRALGALAAIIASSVAVSLTYTWLLWPVFLGIWISVLMMIIYFYYSHVIHQRLQPWCKKCRGGGEEVDTPSPTPVDSVNA